jgi:hypothetical protein
MDKVRRAGREAEALLGRKLYAKTIRMGETTHG